MSLQSVTEYALQQGITRQSAYGRIKRGSLQVVTIGGVKYIESNDNMTATDSVSSTTDVNVSKDIDSVMTAHVKSLKKEVRHLKKQLKEQEKTKDKEYHRLEKLFDAMMNSNIKQIPIIEAEIVKKKKKKHKKK